MVKRLSGPVFPSIKWKSKYLVIIGVIIVLSGLSWGLYAHFHKSTPKVNAGTDPTISQLLTIKTKSVQDSLNKKNYQMATDSCLGGSADAYNLKQYNQAKSILEVCIQKAPDQYVPWYIYSSLAKVAQSLNDKSLEKSSWQTAIKKASASGSDVDHSVITVMQNELQAVK